MSTRSRLHHYLPQSALSHFSVDGKGKTVAVFDKQTLRNYRDSVTKAGAESHFNTVVVDGKRVNLEPAFQDLDNDLAALLERLNREQHLACLSSVDRQRFALLIAVQLLRGKLPRATIAAMPEQLRDAMLPMGIDLPADSLPSIDDNAARIVAMQTLRDADTFARSILTKDWALFVPPPDHVFWTSDHPVIRYNPLPYGDLGLESPGIQLYWPIGQRLLFCASCRSIANKMTLINPTFAARLREETSMLRSEEVRRFNALQVRASLRFVYGPSDDFSVAKEELAKNPELGSPRSWMTVGIPEKPRMPAGTWLVLHRATNHGMIPVEAWQHHPGGIRVRVPQDAATSLQAAIVDQTHQVAEIYVDRSLRWMMRDVTLLPVADRIETATIQHTEAGLHQLMLQLDKRLAE